MPATSFFGNFVHSGFYKLGYVTNDRDRAVDILSKELGVEEFATFSPSFPVTTEDGRTGTASLDCAFSAGRDIFLEVLEPKEGLIDIWSEFLTPADEFQLRFHHTAVIVDDLELVKKSAAALGLSPAVETHLPSGMHFTYFKVPGLGHYIEHDQYDGDSRSFLDSVSARPID